MRTKPHSLTQNYGMDVLKCSSDRKFTSAYVRKFNSAYVRETFLLRSQLSFGPKSVFLYISSQIISD